MVKRIITESDLKNAKITIDTTFDDFMRARDIFYQAVSDGLVLEDKYHQQLIDSGKLPIINKERN
jgi:hypothetical protein